MRANFSAKVVCTDAVRKTKSNKYYYYYYYCYYYYYYY